MKQKTLLFIVMTFFLVQCGQESIDTSETSAEKTWYGYCVDPATPKLFNVNGRTVQKFKCGIKNVMVEAETFSSAQSKGQATCKSWYGSRVRLGNKGNLGPGAAGGDVTTDVSQAFDWFEANCYGQINP